MLSFSVLMSLYIKEKPSYLRQSLESIFKSTLQPSQVVMVLDGPITVEQKSILDDFPQLTLVPLEKNGGLSNALNVGLKYCKYEFIARMDTDDICHPERFEKQVKYFENNPAVDIVGTYSFKMNESGVVIGKMTVPINHEDIYKKVWTCPFIHPTVMFKKDSLLVVGGYNPNSGPRQDDYELWFRCADNGLHFANIPEYLLYYRFFADSVKKNSIKIGWWRMKVGLRGCRKLKLPIWARFGVCVPFVRSLLPYPLNIWFNELMIKLNPRNKVC